MNREDIIRMAREAGGLPDPMVFIGAYERFFQAAYAAGAAAEREACAKVCEDLDAWDEDDPGSSAAKAIRARGQSK